MGCNLRGKEPLSSGRFSPISPLRGGGVFLFLHIRLLIASALTPAVCSLSLIPPSGRRNYFIPVDYSLSASERKLYKIENANENIDSSLSGTGVLFFAIDVCYQMSALGRAGIER